MRKGQFRERENRKTEGTCQKNREKSEYRRKIRGREKDRQIEGERE